MPTQLERFERTALLLSALLFSAGYLVIGLLFILASVIWEGVSTQSVPWRRSPLDLPFLSFVTAFLISGLASAFKEVALGSLALAVITTYLGYGVLYRVLMHDREFLTSFLRTWFVGGFIAAAWALVSSALTGRPAALPELGQNSFATAMVMSFVLGLRWLVEGPTLSRILTSVGLATVTSALILTNARAAWLASAVGLTSFLVLLRWQRGWRALAPILAIVLISLLVEGTSMVSLFAKVESMVGLVHGSDRMRPAVADSALAMLRDHPLVGTGLGTFSLMHSRYPSRLYPGLFSHSSAHNIFLNMAAEGGVLGLSTFIWIVLAMFSATRRLYRNTPPGELPLTSAVIATFIGLLVNQQFEASIVSVHLGTAFAFLLAAQAAGALELRTIDRREGDNADSSTSAHSL